ncbi:MAG: NmrA family NAD(P)-binding protein [Ottowia sp.]
MFSATGTVGQACVNEMLEHTNFTVRVLKRKPGQLDKSTTNAINSDAKEQIFKDWSDRGVEIIEVDATYHAELIPALQGTDYLISCVPYFGTESQYPLIWAAAEAGVERFIPSEFGFIYEFEQFWETPHAHRDMARQKAFIRRVIQLAGLDYTIIPAGLFPEYFMAEPVLIPNGGDAKMAWTTATDAGRIIPHVLSHRLSRNAICPVAGTAWMSWNEFLAIREQHLGRKIEREYILNP